FVGFSLFLGSYQFNTDIFIKNKKLAVDKTAWVGYNNSKRDVTAVTVNTQPLKTRYLWIGRYR
ncbi:MAG: hypothetical protein LUH18_02975, partial [Oscillospiraceae bacterium]|nr:hypothetical protein [Oscillospiraceae bacterium]